MSPATQRKSDAPQTETRRTDQKRAVRVVFEQHPHPMSVADVHAEAQQHVPALGVATVYRHIKTLLDSGWLAVVELPGEPPRYERAGKGHHHHFRCDGCGTVFDVPGCVGRIDQTAPSGFSVLRHEVLLFGLCADCNRAPGDFSG